MSEIYIISAEYGQWEDHNSVEMYVATDYVAAHNRLQSLAIEFASAFSHMVEGMCHGIPHNESINTFQGDDNVGAVAYCSTWDGGVSLVLSSMPVGKTFRHSDRMIEKGVNFLPEGWTEERIAREGEELVATKYELLAEPHEKKYEG